MEPAGGGEAAAVGREGGSDDGAPVAAEAETVGLGGNGGAGAGGWVTSWCRRGYDDDVARPLPRYPLGGNVAAAAAAAAAVVEPAVQMGSVVAVRGRHRAGTAGPGSDG